MGETDGYISLWDSTWDVMAALPILESLGLSHTIDWSRTDLSEQLRFACGNDDLLSTLVPLLRSITHAA
jgi:myo-inositol-1(or 4)-monophosphatase